MKSFQCSWVEVDKLKSSWSWVEWMRHERTLLWLQKGSKAWRFRFVAVLVAFILNFKSVESVTFCHFALRNSIVPSTNETLPLLEQLTPWTRDLHRVKLLHSPYFPALSPPCCYPQRPYPRVFCTLLSFARINRPRYRSVELNDRQVI